MPGAAVRAAGSDPSVEPAAGHTAESGTPPGALLRLGTDDRTSPRVRVVDAALRCIARQGLKATTADDVAREAGVSRATSYRAVPGGRDEVLRAVVETETARLFAELAVAMGEARDLEEMVVAGVVTAARRLSGHAALRRLVAHEPEVVLPSLAFAGLERLLDVAVGFLAPFFGRWLEPDQAARAAEWSVRIVVSYLADPDPGGDISDPARARALVDIFVIPGVQALRAPVPQRQGGGE